jgi:AraC-like DNA-binding protein
VDAQTQHDLLVTYCPETLLRSRSLGSTATAIPGDRGTGRLVRRFLVALLGELESGAPVGSAADVADGLLDLFEGLYNGVLAPRAPDVVRLQVRAFIDEHLADPSLGPDAIAAAHFISRRQLDRLFEDGDATVTESIRRRRLERCREELADPRLRGDSILDIATRWGFVSPAHFSRTFRAAYGMTPRELRQTKMRPPSTTIV